MSVKMSTWVWEHSGAAGNALLVLLALADNADDEGLTWPALATIARKTRLTEAAVRRRLRQLESDGLVAITARPGRPNLFQILARTPGHSSTPTPPHSSTPGDSSTPPHGAGGTPPHGEYPTPPYSLGGGTIIEPSENRQTREDPIETAFETVWAAWPVPRRTTRKTAGPSFRTAVRAVGGVKNLPVILAAVEADAQAWSTWPEADRRKYVPLLTTWLNQERWTAARAERRDVAPTPAASLGTEARDAWLRAHRVSLDEWHELASEHGERDARRIIEGRVAA